MNVTPDWAIAENLRAQGYTEDEIADELVWCFGEDLPWDFGGDAQ